MFDDPRIFLGLSLVGAFFNTYLYGLVTCQYMRYYTLKFNDKLFIKAVVLALFVLDTSQTISVIWMMYNYTVTHFDDVAYASVLAVDRFWPMTWSIISNSINALLTQCVLSYRIYRLTNQNRLVLAGFVSVALAAWTLCTYSQAENLQFLSHPTFDISKLRENSKVFAASRVIDVVVDASLTISLFVILRRARTGFGETDSIISAIILGAVKTGFFCMVMSIVSAALFLSPLSSSTFVASLVAITQGKVSTNVLLDSLLRRNEFRKNNSTIHTTSSLQVATQGQTQATNAIELHVRKDTTTHVVTDDGDYPKRSSEKTPKDLHALDFGIKGIGKNSSVMDLRSVV